MMLSEAARFAGQIGETALGVVGVRVGTEEPSHTTRPLAGGVEIRRYGPRIQPRPPWRAPMKRRLGPKVSDAWPGTSSAET